MDYPAHINRSRRDIVALILGAGPLVRLARASSEAPMRLAISESMVGDVNMNDARPAMLLWIAQMMKELNVSIEISPNVFSTTEEILRGIRNEQMDSVAISILEYRLIEELLDPTDFLIGNGESGPGESLLLVHASSDFKQIDQLRGRKLTILNTPKMCTSRAWLSTLLDARHLGAAEEFFASMKLESKLSRTVLPVFFGQVEACIASKSGFDALCELNPQVGKALMPIAISPKFIGAFYAFRKNYHSATRQMITRQHQTLMSTPAAKQLGTLFNFTGLVVADRSILLSTLGILDEAERHGRKGVVRAIPR